MGAISQYLAGSIEQTSPIEEYTASFFSMQEYEQEIPEFHYRLKVKAGLTGYAQVYGKYNTTPYDKLKLDLFYIENYSFLLDIKLLFMTVKIFFQKEVSEGVDDNQKNALKDSEDKK